MNKRPDKPMSPATTGRDIAELHEFDRWPALWIWPLTLAMAALQGVAVGLPDSYWPWLLAIWPALGVMMFVFVLAFHDASHGRFHPVFWMNEAFGHCVGTFSFTPLHVYRFAHSRHHAQLAREGDPELWPYNSPNVSRPLRMLAAFFEIVFGFVYTPLLFLRAVVVGKPIARVRKLIIRGYIACILIWSIIFVVAAITQLWTPLWVAVVVPMAISGTLQTLNKFEQHLGLHGQSVLGLTRTVVDGTQLSELVSASMLYNDYHGTHHRYARIPYYHLPTATPYTLRLSNEEVPVFPNVASACFDMLWCLTDPKTGPQWLTGNDPQANVTAGKTPPQDAQPVFTGNYRGKSDSTASH